MITSGTACAGLDADQIVMRRAPRSLYASASAKRWLQGAMAVLSGQVAFEIDTDERLTTIVFLGPVTDQQIIDLYNRRRFR